MELKAEKKARDAEREALSDKIQLSKIQANKAKTSRLSLASTCRWAVGILLLLPFGDLPYPDDTVYLETPQSYLSSLLPGHNIVSTIQKSICSEISLFIFTETLVSRLIIIVTIISIHFFVPYNTDTLSAT